MKTIYSCIVLLIIFSETLIEKYFSLNFFHISNNILNDILYRERGGERERRGIDFKFIYFFKFYVILDRKIAKKR